MPQTGQHGREVTLADPDNSLIEDVATFTGINRGRVEAIISGAGGILDSAAFDTGAISESRIGLLVRAGMTGQDTSAVAGSQNVPVEARNADDGLLDFASSLVGFLTNSRCAAIRMETGAWFRLTGDTLTVVEGLSSASIVALYTNSMMMGPDNSGAEVLRRVQVRNADASADYAAALFGLLANTRPSVLDLGSSDWARLNGDLVSNAAGRGVASVRGAYALSVLYGTDNTGASMIEPVEARDSNATADFAAALIGILTNARMGGLDPVAADWKRLLAVAETTGTSDAAQLSADLRQDGYYTSLRGRRYVVTNAAGGTVTGTVGFTATAPVIMIVAGGANELIMRRLVISNQDTTGATVPERVVVVSDTVDRFSAGGTTRTPATLNGGNAIASTAARVLDGAITATAAGAGTRTIELRTLGLGSVAPNEFLFRDALIIPAGGTMLVYVTSATAAVTFVYVYEYEDANIQ